MSKQVEPKKGNRKGILVTKQPAKPKTTTPASTKTTPTTATKARKNSAPRTTPVNLSRTSSLTSASLSVDIIPLPNRKRRVTIETMDNSVSDGGRSSFTEEDQLPVLSDRHTSGYRRKVYVGGDTTDSKASNSSEPLARICTAEESQQVVAIINDVMKSITDMKDSASSSATMDDQVFARLKEMYDKSASKSACKSDSKSDATNSTGASSYRSKSTDTSTSTADTSKSQNRIKIADISKTPEKSKIVDKDKMADNAKIASKPKTAVRTRTSTDTSTEYDTSISYIDTERRVSTEANSGTDDKVLLDVNNEVLNIPVMKELPCEFRGRLSQHPSVALFNSNYKSFDKRKRPTKRSKSKQVRVVSKPNIKYFEKDTISENTIDALSIGRHIQDVIPWLFERFESDASSEVDPTAEELAASERAVLAAECRAAQPEPEDVDFLVLSGLEPDPLKLSALGRVDLMASFLAKWVGEWTAKGWRQLAGRTPVKRFRFWCVVGVLVLLITGAAILVLTSELTAVYDGLAHIDIKSSAAPIKRHRYIDY